MLLHVFFIHLKLEFLRHSQQTQNICTTFVECWTSVEDIQLLYKGSVFAGYPGLNDISIYEK